MITVKMTGKELPQKIKEAQNIMFARMQARVTALAIKMTALVKQKLSGEVLKVKTGRLRRSVNYKVASKQQSVKATIGTNVVYGKTHELGLTIPAHIVEARKAKSLAFYKNGVLLFRKKVNIPAVKMPQRSFLQSSLNQMGREIVGTLKSGVVKDVNVAIRGVQK